MDYIRNSKGKTTEANIVNRRTVLLRIFETFRATKRRAVDMRQLVR